jgi:hypothetical protein
MGSKDAVDHALSEEKALRIAVKGDTETWEQSKELATADSCLSLRCERERGLRFLEISDRDGRGHPSISLSLSALLLNCSGHSHLTLLEICFIQFILTNYKFPYV